MAASKPTCKLSSTITILTTYSNLKTLTTNLGCFPFDKKPYRFLSVYILYQFFSIRSFRNIGKVVKPPAIKKCSTPNNLKIYTLLT
jgi:hypothetical protein